jgi:hypothetical protein
MTRHIGLGVLALLSLTTIASAQQICRGAESTAPMNGRQTMGRGVALSRPDITLGSAAMAQTRPSVFSLPDGLSMSAECLFERLGYACGRCVPMTPETTYDLAYACFIRGMLTDTIAFADRGLSMREDARLYLIKGVAQMRLDLCAEAEVTAEQYLNAIANHHTIGLEYARERVNGPMRVHFEQMVRFISQSREVDRPAPAR